MTGKRSIRQQLRSPDGFEAFYRQHSRLLAAYFARRVFDTQLAFDLTSETFAQALLSVKKLRAETEEEAVGWLYGIARNQLAAYYRRGEAEKRALKRLRIQTPALDEQSEAEIERLADLSELRAAVSEGLASLSESERRAVELRVVEELPYDVVAARLEVTEVAARARVSRGLRSLMAVVEPMLEQESDANA